MGSITIVATAAKPMRNVPYSWTLAANGVMNRIRVFIHRRPVCELIFRYTFFTKPSAGRWPSWARTVIGALKGTRQAYMKRQVVKSVWLGSQSLCVGTQSVYNDCSSTTKTNHDSGLHIGLGAIEIQLFRFVCHSLERVLYEIITFYANFIFQFKYFPFIRNLKCRIHAWVCFSSLFHATALMPYKLLHY